MAAHNLANEAFLFSCAFRMIGNSMDNNSKWCFEDGDYLRCDEVSTNDIQVGREYVIKTDNAYLARRITSFDGKNFTASPLNPMFKECQLCADDVRQIFLIKTYQRKASKDINS